MEIQVVVLPGKSVRAWPGRGEEAKTFHRAPLSDAFTRRYTSDAHFQAVCFKGEAHRLDKSALGSDALAGAAIKIGVLAFDIDSPEAHASGFPATDAWWIFTSEQIETKIGSPAFIYRTRAAPALCSRSPRRSC